MALTIPSTLKLANLKHLAFKCGISNSGTKPILIQRLHDEISRAAQNGAGIRRQRPIRILSIDMGIRNLAYCILDTTSPGKSQSKHGMQLPTIQSWHRLAVSSAPRAPPTPITPSDAINAKEIEKESFTPATLSKTAYNLLRTRLLPHNPTHILIERQRFRSMGSKHILEWTVRVNMFESILYAVLCTLRSEGAWNGTVEAIAPGKVGPFWIGEGEGAEANVNGRKTRKAKSAKAQNKGAKIDLVGSWLEEKQAVQLGNEDVRGVARAYKEKWARAPGGGPAVKNDLGEKMGKLDDLADSLLQGMAWIEWEKNKQIALRYGIEALLKP